MKFLIAMLATAFTFASASASTVRVPTYYSAKFEVESVRPMCPPSVPNGAVCMGLGSIVTLKATIGCIDRLVYSEVNAVPTRPGIQLFVVSVVQQDPNADRIRCAKAQEVRVTETVGFTGEVSYVHNIEIQPAY